MSSVRQSLILLSLVFVLACTGDPEEPGIDAGNLEDAGAEDDGGRADDGGGSAPTQDELFAQMQGVVDWGFSASEAYEDTDLAVRVSNGSPVEVLEGFGNEPPDLADLYRVSGDFATDDLWFGDDGTKSLYWDMGNFDRFINIHNTLGVDYETDPGQVSGLSGDSDQVYMFRLWHGTFYEGIGLRLKWMGTGRFVYFGQNGEELESEPIEPDFGTDYMLRVTYKVDDLSVRVSLNGEVIISDNLSAPLDIREFTIGTNSHPLAHHFRFLGYRRGEFTDEEIGILETNSNSLWPRGVSPTFPYLDGIGSGVYTDFDPAENTWTLPAMMFVGGSGEPGEHRYQWYYWNSDVAGTGILDVHRPFDGATGPVLDRDDYSGPGEAFDGHEGDAFNRVFCVITPVDSEGVAGIRARSVIWVNNIE